MKVTVVPTPCGRVMTPGVARCGQHPDLVCANCTPLGTAIALAFGVWYYGYPKPIWCGVLAANLAIAALLDAAADEAADAMRASEASGALAVVDWH